MSSRFVKSLDEIIEACPNSRWRNEEKLFPAIADEELTLLLPILGDTLMEWLEEQGDALREEYGSIVESEVTFEDDADDAKRHKATVTLLAQVRKAVIYRMLANNSEILSTSLNEGGGHNRMETDQYDSMSMDDLDKLAKKYYRNSIARLETILLLLEKDARRDTPVFKDMWMECEEYFYLHAGLLFPHLRSMKHYYKIGDERLKYAQLCPDIRFCQQTYIAPTIGEDVVKVLCGLEIDNKTSADAEGTVAEGTDADRRDVLLRTLDMARTALGLYVQGRTAPKDERSALMDSADMARAQLCRFISAHQMCFGDAIKTSPLYTQPVDDSGDDTCRCRHGKPKQYTHFTMLGKPIRRY